MDNTLEKWQKRWNSEGVRILVLTSLSIQIGLMFLAPLRKRSGNKVLALTIWLLYLTAEFVPTLALGNLGKQIDPTEIGDSGTIPGDITVLWAPFLLLHLGGPDTISSYSIDDNELWWRLPLGLVIQVVAAVYIFWQSPQNPVLWIPTILVCIVGLIKFAERVQALRSGSRDYIKEKIISEISPAKDIKEGQIITENMWNRGTVFEDYLKDLSILEQLPANDIPTFNQQRNEHFPVDLLSMSVNESQRQCQAIWEGYGWFDIFKRLLVDVSFSSKLIMYSQDRFSEMGSKETINLISIELSFLYDILHTKAIHKHSTLGCLLHCSFLVSIIAAFVVFHHLDMQKYASKDVIITYILFGAGLALEIIATFLLVSSDWTVVSLRKTGWGNFISRSITAMVKEITFRNEKSRWSRTIGQYNLVGFCLRDRDTVLAKIMRILKIKHKWDNMCESRSKPLLQGLFVDIMFTESKRRAQNIEIYHVFLEAGPSRGSKTLERHDQLQTLGWSVKKEFDECIILWHVATDICYYKEISNQPKGYDDTERDVSWKTSNYMVYLLTQQQSMMQVGYGKKRFEATCAVVKKKFKGKGKLEDKKARIVLEEDEPHNGKGDEVVIPVLDNISQSGWSCWVRRKGEEDKRKVEDEMGELVLKDCRRLAQQLHELNPYIKWKLISETWMEMLGFAAIHCNSYQHAKTLSRGGELLTHMWLLTSQLGILEKNKRRQFEK